MENSYAMAIFSPFFSSQRLPSQRRLPGDPNWSCWMSSGSARCDQPSSPWRETIKTSLFQVISPKTRGKSEGIHVLKKIRKQVWIIKNIRKLNYTIPQIITNQILSQITPISGPTISLKLFKRVPKKNCLSAAGPSQGSNFNRITQRRACVIRKWENINGDDIAVLVPSFCMICSMIAWQLPACSVTLRNGDHIRWKSSLQWFIHGFFGSKSQQMRPWKSYPSFPILPCLNKSWQRCPWPLSWTAEWLPAARGLRKITWVLGCLIHSDVVLKKTSTKSCCCFAGFHKNHRMLFNYSSWVAMGRCHRSTSTILIDTTTDEHSDSASCFEGIFTDLQDSTIRQSHFEGLDRLVDSSEAGNGKIVEGLLYILHKLFDFGRRIVAWADHGQPEIPKQSVPSKEYHRCHRPYIDANTETWD